MRIFILADEAQKKELQSKNTEHNNELAINTELPENDEYKNYDAFFILSQQWHLVNFELFGLKPAFINAVIETLSQLKLPENVSRINAWPGFLQRDVWEIVSNNQQGVKNLFDLLKWEIIFVKDEPGFVSVRVISMIINEAFFALGENISTKEEIDLAMKLGTNYPQGPFEWIEKIGVQNIYKLLNKLSEKEERYLPAPALEKLYFEK